MMHTGSENIRLVLLPVFLLFVSIGLAQNSSLIGGKIDSLSHTPALMHAQWSLYAEYADDGQAVLDFNSSESLAPASGLKVFTTSAALYYLGEDYRYETSLYASGKLDKKGMLKGDLIIRGAGDPTFGSPFVKGSLKADALISRLAEAVKNAGIKKITGRIIADESLFSGPAVPGAWYWEDIGNYYGAAASAVCIADNTYKVTFSPGEKEGDPAKIIRLEPEISGLSFENYMLTGAPGSGDNGYIYCAPGGSRAELRGTVPAGVSEFSIKGSIPSPAAAAAGMLRSALVSNGISVKGEAASGAASSAHQHFQPENAGPAEKRNNESAAEFRFDYDNAMKITSVNSPCLKDIVYMTNKRSNNLYTEQLLRTVASDRKGEGSEEKGIETLYEFLDKAGVPRQGVSLCDGCGLSRSDMITSRAMAGLLSFNYHQKYFGSFYNSLEIAGDPDDIGYHQKMGLNTIIAKNVRLKSGLINKVRSHSGYLRTRSGRMISFSFIANNYTAPYTEIDAIHERVMISLAELK